MAPAIESLDLEVCKFLLVGQRSRGYLSLSDGDTSLDGFETISVNLQITTFLNSWKRQYETNTVRQFAFSIPDKSIIKAIAMPGTHHPWSVRIRSSDLQLDRFSGKKKNIIRVRPFLKFSEAQCRPRGLYRDHQQQKWISELRERLWTQCISREKIYK